MHGTHHIVLFVLRRLPDTSVTLLLQNQLNFPPKDPLMVRVCYELHLLYIYSPVYPDLCSVGNHFILQSFNHCQLDVVSSDQSVYSYLLESKYVGILHHLQRDCCASFMWRHNWCLSQYSTIYTVYFASLAQVHTYLRSTLSVYEHRIQYAVYLLILS